MVDTLNEQHKEGPLQADLDKAGSKKHTSTGRGRLRPCDIGLARLDSSGGDDDLMESEVGLLSDEGEDEFHGGDSPVTKSRRGLPIHSYSIPQTALHDSDEEDDLGEEGNEQDKHLPPGRQSPGQASGGKSSLQVTTFTVTAASAKGRSKPTLMMDDLDSGPRGAEENHLVLMTFVGRSKGVRNVKKSLHNTFKQAKQIMPATGDMFSICENFDTYQKGGLYPLLHVCRTPKDVEKVKESEQFLEEDSLGDGLLVDQALFREVSSIEIPGSDAEDFVLTVAAFKSIDSQPNPKLLKNWKSWTGARAFFEAMLAANLDCQKMSFLVRDSPLVEDDEHTPGFYYLLVCEVGIRKPRDEGLIVDVLQRFRVERWFGYQTIYRHYRQ